MWSLRRTENPRELDRNQPTPRKNAPVAQLGRGSRFKTYTVMVRIH